MMGTKKKCLTQALHKCDENAATRPPAGKASSSSDDLIPNCCRAAKIGTKDDVLSMEISIGKNSKATRQPTREKTRKRDSNEETQAQKKKDKNKDKKNDKSKQEKNEGKKEGKKEKKVKKTEGSTTHTVAIPVQEDNEAILAPEMTAKTRKRLKDARKFVTKDRTGMGRTDDASDLLDDQYDDEIVEYTRSLEEKMKPNPSYMEHQDDIDWSMRAKLVEWLVQFRMVFDLKPEVLSTAVNYLDRFLSVKTVYREKLQLVGCTALFIASKYESVSQIKKKTMVAMSQDAFTVEELLRAEWYMLNALNFELGWPAPTGFLERLKKADRKSKRAQHMSRCFLDIIMIDRRFVSCVPSYLAAGADCLARFMLKQKNWSPYHIHYSGYTLDQLRPLLHLILTCCYDRQPHHAVLYRQQYEDDSKTDAKTHRKNDYEEAWETIEKKISSKFALPWE